MASKRYTDQDIINAVNKAHSYREVCRILGVCDHGGSSNTIKNAIIRLNLDISHFTGKSWAKGQTAKTNLNIRKKDLSEVLIENSKWDSYKIKNRLIEDGYKEYKCECCGITEWNGKPAPLELHHINGNHSDNRLENLQILCCNCHAQTENYSKQKVTIKKGRTPKTYCSICGNPIFHNSKTGMCVKCYNLSRACINNCPSVEELQRKKVELKSYVQIGKFYNVSDKTVKKWFKARGLLE